MQESVFKKGGSMFGELFRLIGKVIGFTSGIAIIALIIMWFGCVPMVATIFGQISGWMYLLFTGIGVALIGLVIYWLKD